MRLLIYLLPLFLFFSCKNTSVEKQETPVSAVEKTEKPASNTKEKKPKECFTKEKYLKGNLKTLQDVNQELAIVADVTTYDSKFGDSHRILVVKDRNDCKEIFRQILPTNYSPDFPFYLADINYNNTNPLVAIRGYNNIYVYNIKNKEVLPALKPQYKNTRTGQDAQSGQITHLELWENYIIGFAMDYGSFVFQIQENGAIKPILPYAEYPIPGTERFHSLFTLESNNNTTQLLFPSFDVHKKTFYLNPVFENAMHFDMSKGIISKNNRYVILQQIEGKRPFVIDLKTRKKKELTAAQVASQPVQLLKALLSES